MADYYDELLKICGFEPDEINGERSRVQNALQKLDLGFEDMKTAEDWVKQNHDTDLVGVRKLLGVWLKELIDLVLAKEEGKKIVYYGFPTITGPGMSIAAASEEVYCACPDVILCHTMGQIFNKLNPILEAGEENGLPPGHSLCTLQTIRVGALAKGIIPIPDLVLTSSYFCDAGTLTDQLLKVRYGHPAIYVDGSMDSAWGEYPGYSPQRVEFLGAQLDKLFDRTEELLGIKVTREVWDKAISISRELYRGIGQLSKLTKSDPIPVSQAEVELAAYLPSGCTGKAMTDGPEAISTLIQEVRERVDKGVGVVDKGAPRVMLFSGPFSDASITRMIEDSGLALAATLISVPVPKKKHDTVQRTLGEEIAEREMIQGFYHSNYGLVRRWINAIKELDMDGSIWNYQFNCRPLAQPSHFLPKLAEEETGVPCLSLEMDYYDSRTYSAAALRTRVETFAEMLRAKKASGKAMRVDNGSRKC